MPSVSFFSFFFFGVTLVHVNLFLHTFTHMNVTLRGVGVGDYSKKCVGAEKCTVASEKFMERSIRVLKCIYVGNISLSSLNSR